MTKNSEKSVYSLVILYKKENMLDRFIKKAIEDHFFENRVLILYGARQVGKTTLAKAILRDFGGRSLYLNCDEPDIRAELTDATSTRLKSMFGDAELIVQTSVNRAISDKS